MPKEIFQCSPLTGYFAEQVTGVSGVQIHRSRTNVEHERRMRRRFEIELDVRYRVLYGHRIAETGTGRTFNISSGGVWFTTNSMLTTGMPVELSVAWPALLNDCCALQLIICGCVVRSNERAAAVAIEGHEFHTAGHLAPQKVNQAVWLAPPSASTARVADLFSRSDRSTGPGTSI
ncbi:MAG: hypothetical protein ABSH49_13290 [Bryobacteraceae bacterium]